MSEQSMGGRDMVPSFLSYSPVHLRFGTSGLRGLVRDMTDLEVYINTRGFLAYLFAKGELVAGGEVAVGEDLRQSDPISGLSSSPRIGRAVVQAIADAGCKPVHCGQLPTPALAHFAFSGGGESSELAMPSIMVTGSHIPADRNGVKFYCREQEVLKSDEAGILAAVVDARIAEYAKSADDSPFDAQGMLKESPPLLRVEAAAEQLYLSRYLNLFAGETPLSGMRVVFYQHSAVGRDLIVQLLESMGAEVFAVDRSEVFVSVDTEDVSEKDLVRFAGFARNYRPDAILSTDGDSDRPLVLDEKGCFHRGDVLGLVTAEYLGARYCAVPVSASDAIEKRFASLPAERQAEVERTRIGSPHVIAAMDQAARRVDGPVVGWESNGGFLTKTVVSLNGRKLAPLPTRDAVLPMLCALLSARDQRIPLSEVFAQLPQRATGAGLIDDFPVKASAAIIAAFSPGDKSIREVRFGDETLAIQQDGPWSNISAEDPMGRRLWTVRRQIEEYFSPENAFASVETINYVDGVRIVFSNGEIAHMRPSGNAPQLRIYALSSDPKRTSAIVKLAIAEPDGFFRRMEHELLESHQDGMVQRGVNLEALRDVVATSKGPRQVIAIANGGDSEIVKQRLRVRAKEIFRADGDVRVFAHEERKRRGQLLGLLDAVRDARQDGLDDRGVALGIMLPGQGTRLSPLTQRLHGIKPFFPMVVRHGPQSPFLSGAAASLFSWTFVAFHLERLGFEGVAWKWGDEPQIPARDLSVLTLDLSLVDAVRFGSEVGITDDLARNKEWLLADPQSSELKMQVRRRSRQELVERFGLQGEAEPRALVHIGSPALSYRFMAAAERVFGGLAGWLDVDGYLFEALTHDPEAWKNEIKRDSGLRELLADYPDFYEQVGQVRDAVEHETGRPLSIKVVDFGADLYWGDIGQLSKARDAYGILAHPGIEGLFARELAAIDHVKEDAHGNLLVGGSSVPDDGSIKHSVVINSRIGGPSGAERAVIVDSDLGRLEAHEGGVAVGCTSLALKLGPGSFAFNSVERSVCVGANEVHTSLPKNPKDIPRGLESYRWQMPEDPGRGNAYQEPAGHNPRSFAEAFALMRQRDVSPDEVDAAIEALHRVPLRKAIGDASAQ